MESEYIDALLVKTVIQTLQERLLLELPLNIDEFANLVWMHALQSQRDEKYIVYAKGWVDGNCFDSTSSDSWLPIS